MGNPTWAYAVAGLLAALIVVVERFGSAPTPAVQGTSGFAAGMTAADAHDSARKADARFRARERRR